MYISNELLVHCPQPKIVSNLIINNLPRVLRAALVKVMASGIAREAVGTFDILVFTGPEEILNQFEKKK